MNHIGTLNEKPLHSALKQLYAAEGAQLEHRIGRYVVDIFQNGHIIEIQTANFSSIGKKLRALLESYPITLVYPVAQVKWIVKESAVAGGESSRRKSPKKQDVVALFLELVRIPDLIAHHHFSIEVVLTHEEEVRHFEGNRGWRKKGWVTSERRLLEVIDTFRISTPADLLELIVHPLPEPFLTSDLASAIGQSRWIAQKMAYCLKACGLIRIVGKQGNAIRYAICAA